MYLQGSFYLPWSLTINLRRTLHSQKKGQDVILSRHSDLTFKQAFESPLNWIAVRADLNQDMALVGLAET